MLFLPARRGLVKNWLKPVKNLGSLHFLSDVPFVQQGILLFSQLRTLRLGLTQLQHLFFFIITHL